MSMQLGNRYLAFRLEDSGVWSVAASGLDSRLALRGRCSAHWQEGSARKSWQGSLPETAIVRSDVIETPEGAAPSVTAEFQVDAGATEIALEWAVPENRPFLLWRAKVRSGEPGPFRLGSIELLRTQDDGRSATAGGRDLGLEGLSNPAAFISGWQSFGFAGTLGRGDRHPRTRLGPLVGPSREQPGLRAPRSSGRFLSDMFAVVGDRTDRVGLLLGAVAVHEAFTSLDLELSRDPIQVRLWCHGDDVVVAPGRTFTTDWAYAEFIAIDQADPLGSYIRLAGRAGGARVAGESPDGLTGWCSWYRHYRNIDEETIERNLSWLAEHRQSLPLDVFLVDDGYEQKVGDWYPPWPGFPGGPARLAAKARDRGLTPGLWIAPFVAEASSRLAKEHPDWILRSAVGRPRSIGLLGSNTPFALDATHPAVLDHLSGLVETAVGEWGFGALKLDFLYAAALQGKRSDPSRTRAQAFREALSRLRAAAGEECWILGCGCPLGAAIGLVDSMRISPDVAPHWHPHYRGVHLIMQHETTVPAARNSLRNAINLAPLQGRWWVNDPDCVILQPEPSGWADAAPMPLDLRPIPDRWRVPRRLTRAFGLKPHEVQTLLTVNSLTGSALIDSDYLPEVETERLGWLARMLPPLGPAAAPADWFDSAYPSVLVRPLEGAAGQWYLVCMVNWSEQTRQVSIGLDRLGLPTGVRYHAIDFWHGTYSIFMKDTLSSPALPAHGVFLTSLRKQGIAPTWLGDDLHISMGMAVQSFRVRGQSLQVDLALPRSASGRAWIGLPAHPSSAAVNGRPVAIQPTAEGVYCLPISWDRSARLDVHWGASSTDGVSVGSAEASREVGRP
jgi:alpha-galactosidase